MTLSTHVLDTTAGCPADGVAVLVERRDAGGWTEHGTGRTGGDGRLRLDRALHAGEYRITFGSGEYFAGRGLHTFYPRVTVTFTVTAPAEHYHVPLLLSPYAYATYRGS